MVILRSVMNMNRTIGVVAFIFAIAASFYSGFLYRGVDPVASGQIDERIVEVMEQLQENHYSQPSEEDLVQGAIDGMIAALDDPFTTYFSASQQEEYNQGFEESYVGIGITVSYVDNLIVVEQVATNGPADQAGILVNDIIAFIDGEDVRGDAFYQTIAKVVGEVGSMVEIGVIRQGVDLPIYFEIERQLIDSPSITYESFEEDGKLVGYIDVNTFGAETASLFSDAIAALEEENIDGMIIDLRDNGGGYLSAVISMLDEFLIDNGKPMFSTEYYTNGSYRREEYFATNQEEKTYEIFTLINGNSASASEVFASSMQEHGGHMVVGTTSFGKGTMQTDVPLQAMLGDSIHLTIGKWFTSNEGWVHYDGGSDGVTPDLIVEPTELMQAYKVFLLEEDEIGFDTVNSRLKNIQVILNGLGYSVRTDGYFDEGTKEAIENLQVNNDLPSTGEINQATLQILNDYLTLYKNNPRNDQPLMEAVGQID
jgi:carboxyl-terminal processing protease